MQPILFHIPFVGIPVYGYGLMLFFAFIFCNLLARRLCKREGIDGDLIPDLAIWFFVSGIVGGRVVFVITEWHNGFDARPWLDLLKLWDGGLVLYGAVFGGTLGFFAYHHFVMRKHGVSVWKMFDVMAPPVALGIALGRVGCLFTGCCYGNVAGESCPALHFPHHSPAWAKMVERGYQTPLGFLFKDDSFEIEAVEPDSAAASVLKVKDVIVEVNGIHPLRHSQVVPTDGALRLTVIRDGKTEELPPFEPRSIGVNPTQIYETISMCLLMYFLLSYYPYKRHDGELLVFLMLGYSVHRFLNEMLRTDTNPVAFGLTLSQNVSIGIFALGIVLAVLVWRRPAIGSE